MKFDFVNLKLFFFNNYLLETPIYSKLTKSNAIFLLCFFWQIHNILVYWYEHYLLSNILQGANAI